MMASKKSSLAGCIAYVYDTRDNLLATTTIIGYDPEWMEIEVENCPEIKVGDTCRVLILSFPSPYEYMGTVRQQLKTYMVIALYRKKEKEGRKNVRHSVNASATITKVICAGRSCETALPLAVKVINLSRGGIRIDIAADVLTIGDRVEIRLMAESKETQLLAEVVNASRTGSDSSEYGCRFITREYMFSKHLQVP